MAIPGLPPLPVDALLPEAVACLRGGRNLVLEAAPGAGKTTRLPRALLESGLLDDGACWILEPRRLAARLAAARVAEELGEPLGHRVGYAVRFEQRVSPATQIRFVTEAMLLRRFQRDPDLKDIRVVVLDEFHERHLHGDVALALLRQLQLARRPDLGIVVMSATLEGQPIADHLDAVRLQSQGRPFPVDIRHHPSVAPGTLGMRVATAVDTLYAEGRQGHTLVFLPGAAEIRQALSACAETARRRGLTLLPLHGSLSFEAQKAAVAPSPGPKVLLATNVAESSVTIDGVVAVVDSGMAREAIHSAWSGLPSLRTMRISQARCLQRTGRAGRQSPGVCVRLFPETDFQARAPFDTPELLRADLAETLLALKALGHSDLQNLPWLQAPPKAAIEAGERLLALLGATDAAGALTGIGRRMVHLPLSPRMGRLWVAGQEEGIPDTAALAVALLEAGDLHARRDLGVRTSHPHALDCDLWPRLDAFREAEAAGFAAATLRLLGLDASAVHQARQAYGELKRGGGVDQVEDGETRLLRALLQAFPDRVARRSGGGETFALVGGGGARLDGASRCHREPLLVALEADEIPKGTGRETVIRAASRIEPEWLLEAFPEAISDRNALVFQDASGSVEHVGELLYRDLVIDSTRRRARGGEPGVAACLGAAALDKGLGEGQLRLDQVMARCAFVARMRPDLGVPEGTDLRRQLVEAACQGLSQLKDVAHMDWRHVLRETLGTSLARLLEALAPETVALGPRSVPIHYEGDAPWIASRLQDFFGLQDGPRIAAGTVPLVLHLLAPNQRAVQVTTDLAGFWQRAYQELRPALSRRYPKHAWPEQPTARNTPRSAT